ncbi:hypothetical protein F4561_005904 [Lipingzhangella halophila]|uniref:Putative sensor domain-containing protein n=1 Tax=Lipingzhangella halophila TaxID=1783352 RepID=A0A7W7W6M7_9ACTN|nr:sensor domain-containing protein [Lipingzhangella halophila]MBB4935010.1 hypothetical protein [Lipingzhangella halophila]
MSFLTRLSTDTRYLLFSFPLALIGFALLVVGFSLGIGTAVIGIGLPVLAATLAVARRLGDIERHALPEILDQRAAQPAAPVPPAGPGIGPRLRVALGSGRSWLDLLHGVVTFPVTVVCSSLTFAWWVGAVGALAWPLYGWVLRGAIPDYVSLPQLIDVGGGYVTDSAFYVACGVLLAVTLPPLVRGLALTRARLAQIILTAAPMPAPFDGPGPMMAPPPAPVAGAAPGMVR